MASKDASFDIVSTVELQEVDNAISQALKELSNRFDLKGTNSTIERKDYTITINSQDDFSVKQVIDILELRLSSRKVPLKALTYGKIENALGQRAKVTIDLSNGLTQEQAKKLTALIKASKLKVQATIQGDTVRVSGKSRDDLQTVIQLIRDEDLDFNTQFVNYR
ncbi:YajQ family cyclic di-GMP-binding protein [Guggenheimella bovis]